MIVNPPVVDQRASGPMGACGLSLPKVVTMLVVTRLRVSSTASPDELRTGLEQARQILAGQSGFLGGEVGRNIDDPDLWVLSTRWKNVGSYRRALSSYEAKMFIQPLMMDAVDEPSAYEVVEPGAELNEAGSRG